jgi:hypothetical protein
MAEEAEQRLAGTGWLPQPLRGGSDVPPEPSRPREARRWRSPSKRHVVLRGEFVVVRKCMEYRGLAKGNCSALRGAPEASRPEPDRRYPDLRDPWGAIVLGAWRGRTLRAIMPPSLALHASARLRLVSGWPELFGRHMPKRSRPRILTGPADRQSRAPQEYGDVATLRAACDEEGCSGRRFPACRIRRFRHYQRSRPAACATHQ